MTPLHYFGGAIRDAMTAVPMIWVRALFVGLLLALQLAVALYFYLRAPDLHPERD